MRSVVEDDFRQHPLPITPSADDAPEYTPTHHSTASDHSFGWLTYTCRRTVRPKRRIKTMSDRWSYYSTAEDDRPATIAAALGISCNALLHFNPETAEGLSRNGCIQAGTRLRYMRACSCRAAYTISARSNGCMEHAEGSEQLRVGENLSTERMGIAEVCTFLEEKAGINRYIGNITCTIAYIRATTATGTILKYPSTTPRLPHDYPTDYPTD